ncbi:DUF6053 domain-containing protein [Lysobacter enzymogenes]|uniref:DUF6053 domain-containing protein n=1 Tax=Lysobacter enzymogenes TaxID=69 RepID=UPI00374A8FE3
MGAPSGPTLLSQTTAIRPASVGPEGPPTRAARRNRRPTRSAAITLRYAKNEATATSRR